jgi:3',5'-nucleoside bisphosphate phosphatase
LGKADLHTHTNASDGALTPKELILKAKSKGLKTVSITDHDTIKGYLQAVPYAAEHDIELLPGVEITALWNNREVHLLAYLFDVEDENFINLLLRQKRARILRMKAIVEELKKKGIDIDIDEVRAESGPGNLGRPHAASVLISKGYVATVAEAFIRYLSTEKLVDIKTEYATIEEVVEITKQAGGVLSLAHPGPIYSQTEIEELIAKGLDGIECIHPSHNFNVQQTFKRLAESRKLLMTGGSDYHGTGKSDYDPYFGTVTVGDQHVASIKRLSERRKKEKNE